jgi:hypothetical protein
VCGGEARGSKEPWGPARCDRCGAEHDFGPEWPAGFPRILHLPPPPYSTSWEASGRLCEEMEAKGWRLKRLSREELGTPGKPCREFYAAFERFEDEGWLVDEHYGWAEAAPSALALAALRALGERREG